MEDETVRAARIAASNRFLDKDFLGKEKSIAHQYRVSFDTVSRVDKIINKVQSWTTAVTEEGKMERDSTSPDC